MKKIIYFVLFALMSVSAYSQFTILHSFQGGSVDGANPTADLLLSGSTLYGMTNNCGSGCYGTIFKINTDGSGLSLLHTFSAPNGSSPFGSLILSGSVLYGETNYTGAGTGAGTIFKMNTDGTSFTILHTFNATDGSYPCSQLVLLGSYLYGTTENGGLNNNGTIFKISTDGSNFNTLHRFALDGSEGVYPVGTMVLSGSILYGMTTEGGSNNLGTIFKINTDGSGFSVIYSFDGSHGNFPYGSLIIVGSLLYGLTSGGGIYNHGTIFKINTDGSGISVLHSFAGANSDGDSPNGSLLLIGTILYGMTSSGGNNNYGSIFQINTNGNNYSMIYSFSGGNSGGLAPDGSLINSGTLLFGMTKRGGSYNIGTVFSYVINTISISSISTSICPSSSISVPFTISGTYNSGNTFTAQLSNSNGDFSSPTSIGTLTGTGSGTISCTIPSNASAGSGYRVRVVSSNPAITGTDNGSNIMINTKPSPTISGTLTVCAYNAYNYTTNTTAGTTYKWYATSGTIVGSSTGINVNITWNTAGTGTTKIIQTNSSGCIDSLTQNITINALPTVTLSNLTPVCINAAEFSLTQGSPTGGVYSGKGVSSNKFNPSTAGAGSWPITYTFTNSNGCIDSASKSITVNSLPNVSLTDFGTKCINDPEITLTQGTPAGGTYTGNGVNNNKFNPSVAGVGATQITYTYTDNNGCANTAVKSITVNDKPNVTLNNFSNKCIYDAEFVLNQGTPSGGVYSGNGVNSNKFNPSAAGVGNTQITYTYTDNNGCSNSVTKSITVNDMPNVTLSDLGGKCINDPAFTLTQGNPPGGTYTGQGVSNNKFNPSSAGLGTFQITYTYTDNNTGCTKSITKSIVVSNQAYVTLNDFGNKCINDPEFTLTQGYPTGGTYSGNGVQNNKFNPAVAGIGITQITYSYTDKSTGCSGSITRGITVNNVPKVTLSNFDSKCINDPEFTLTQGSPTGGTYFGQGIKNNKFNPSTAGVGTWQITYNDTNNNGCSGSATGTIIVNDKPQKPVITKSNDSTKFISSLSSGYQWYCDGNLISGATGKEYIPAKSGNYSCVVTDINGCNSDMSDNYYFISTGVLGGIETNNIINIYPIPAETYISLSLPLEYQNSSIKIYSVEGIEVLETECKDKIDVSSFSTGVYYVKVRDKVSRFIKM